LSAWSVPSHRAESSGRSLFLYRLLSYSGPTRLEGIMGKKRPKTSASAQLDELLKTYALRRLEHGSPNAPKPKKVKRSKKR
jgi:hypothetical protein